MIGRLLIVTMAVALCHALPQQQQSIDYDYLYEDLVEPNLVQAQAPVVVERSRAPPRRPAPSPVPQPQQAAPRSPPSKQQQRQSRILAEEDVSTTTHIPILKDSRRTDPVTGAFIYDYMGADGQTKFEVRFPNGTVIGNFSFINDQGERETRWYSAGERGTEISGDGVISPAPPTLLDETTDPNYIDLSNYELYRHLEVPYVHIAGPSDPDERGQLSNPGRAPSPQGQLPRAPQASSVPLDFGDDLRFTRPVQQPTPTQVRQPVAAPQPRPVQQQPIRPRARARPAQVSALTTQQIAQSHFNAASIDASSPDAVLDSLISQFQ